MSDVHRILNVAVVGYGYWGSKHVRVVNSLPDVRLSVVDPDPARRREAGARNPAVRLAGSLHEIARSLDAVIVATPPGTHAHVAAEALDAGLHVLVEKPLTTSVDDAEMLVERAERRGLTLMTGHTFEYNPAVTKLRELVRSGALGRIFYVDTARLSLGRYQNDVNVVWDLAPHDISIISYVLGEIPSPAAAWTHCNVGGRHADVAYLRFDFPLTRTQAFVQVSWLSPNKVRRVTLVGEKKMAVYDDLSDNERLRIYDIGVDIEALDDPRTAHALPVTYRTGDIVSPFIAFEEPLKLQDEHFVDCIRTGATPRTSGRRGLDIVRVLAATDRLSRQALPAAVEMNGNRAASSELAGPVPRAYAPSAGIVPTARS